MTILSDNFPSQDARLVHGLTNALLTAGSLLSYNPLSIPNQTKQCKLYVIYATLKSPEFTCIFIIFATALMPHSNNTSKTTLPDQQLHHSNLHWKSDESRRGKILCNQQRHGKVKAAPSVLEEGQYDQKQLILKARLKSSKPSTTLP